MNEAFEQWDSSEFPLDRTSVPATHMLLQGHRRRGWQAAEAHGRELMACGHPRANLRRWFSLDATTLSADELDPGIPLPGVKEERPSCVVCEAVSKALEDVRLEDAKELCPFCRDVGVDGLGGEVFPAEYTLACKWQHRLRFTPAGHISFYDCEADKIHRLRGAK